MGSRALRSDDSVGGNLSLFPFLSQIKCFSRAEIERNRRKVMEINYFLDNQQINFDTLTTDIVANVSFKVVKIKDDRPLAIMEESGLVEEAAEGEKADQSLDGDMTEDPTEKNSSEKEF
jgi:hypothetical protein